MAYRIVPLERKDSSILHLAYDFLGGHIHNGHWFGLMVGEKLVGIGCVDTTHATAVLYSGFVHQSHRGKGYHRALMRHRCEYARECGCTAVKITVRATNEYCLKNVYREGFTRYPGDEGTGHLTFIKYLNEDEDDERADYSCDSVPQPQAVGQ